MALATFMKPATLAPFTIPAVTVNTVINAYINAINMKMDIFVDDFVTGLTLEETNGQPEQEANNVSAEA